MSGYVVPGAVWSAPSGVKVDPYDPAFNADMDATGEPDKPAIYLFSNSRSGDGIAYAMAEDGHVLGSHLCSHWGYMRHDLHDRPDRKAACEAHYPTGYRLVILGPNEVPPGDVLGRNRALAEREERSDGDIDVEAADIAGVADIHSLRERRRGVVETGLITVKEDDWNRVHAELSRLRSVVAGVEAVADRLIKDADEIAAIGHLPHSAAHRRGASEAFRDAERRLRSVLSDTTGGTS